MTPSGDDDRLATEYLFDLWWQAKSALQSDLFLPALSAALTTPDVCGALRSPPGTGNGSRYRAWLAAFTDYSSDETAMIWAYRNSVLHEGSGRSRKERVMFLAPGGPMTVHRSRFEFGSRAARTVAWAIDIMAFLDELAAGLRAFVEAERDLPIVQANLAHALRLYPKGLPPFIVGAPVVG